MRTKSFFFTFLLFLSLSFPAGGTETHPNNGVITDPFGDPMEVKHASSAVKEETKVSEHHPRHLMFVADLGVAGFTGGLGQTNSSGLFWGLKGLYFLGHAIALEGGFHLSHHQDTIEPLKGGTPSIINVTMIPLNLGLRYYFGERSSPWIDFFNPYAVAGAGIYVRQENVQQAGTISFQSQNTSGQNFGVYGGAGSELPLYKDLLFFGADFRYHFVFFPDANDTLGGNVAPGALAGNYYSVNATFTYSLP